MSPPLARRRKGFLLSETTSGAEGGPLLSAGGRGLGGRADSRAEEGRERERDGVPGGGRCELPPVANLPVLPTLPLFVFVFVFSSSSSSSSSSLSPCCRPGLGSSHRKAARWKASAVASVRAEDARDPGGNRRRALLLVGLSAIPFLQLPAVAAVDGLEKASWQAPEGGGSSVMSFLSEIGIVGSGVLGALYAISKKEKSEMELAIASMNTTLSEKEAANVSLEVNFKRRLEREQEEHRKQMGKLKEAEAFLSQQLASAKGTVAAIGVELKNEKRLAEDLRSQIDQLRSSLAQAREEKEALEAKHKKNLDVIVGLEDRVSLLTMEIKDKEGTVETLRSTLSGRESEIKNLTSAVEQSKLDLEEAVSALTQLKAEQLKAKEELDSNRSQTDELTAKIDSLLAERDDAVGKYQTLQGEFDRWKLDFENKLASNSELLSTKDQELRRLEENLGAALTEAKSSWVLITNLTDERDSLKATLEEESSNLKTLRDELLVAQQTLGDSKREASDLLKQLQESNRVNEELASEISRIKSESLEAQTLLNASLGEARSASKVLSDELVSIKRDLKKAQEDLDARSGELRAAIKARDGLEKELAEASVRAESTELELKRERETVAALSRELEASAQQREELSEARRAIESDLGEATKSLDEVKKKLLSLSKELEDGNSLNATLRAEKEMLYESLLGQKNAAREAQENIEDAQNVITRLGAEREKLEKKVKKFEEELAASKGEILRLRRQVSLEKESVGEQDKKAHEAEPAGASSMPKRSTSRRRKAGSAPRASQPET
ncbi:unnamed protein product [Spirodela intermedia]|uniref:Uncharacterized protein n=1 Tax=Spirodela intermedia TaxID=51605 RepID=A0A7I8J7Q4_SPIIN|nr:unnamed protein product [Spirodela intermedia]CAA6666268.1 unnamed protein product [Spirodela intermedia]